MKIVTKFNIGDIFFTIDGGKIKQHTVNFLSFTSTVIAYPNEPIIIKYFPVDKAEKSAYNEAEVFKSKRLLLRSLQS